MLIPYNTDAPLYHPPFATIGTIILNVMLFLPVFMHDDPYASKSDGDFDAENFEADERPSQVTKEDVPYGEENEPFIDPAERQKLLKQLESLQRQRTGTADRGRLQEDQGQRTAGWRLLTLEFGKFRPWQWLTANYMHAGLFHLLGNMFVLWGFGLVVEGKVGWWRFLVIYNGIGILGWGFVQFFMLFAHEGIGLGASLAIFGILAIALVWAPANEMQCVFLLGFRPITFESSIMNIALFSLVLQVAISVFYIITVAGMGVGLRITSEFLHLIGGVLGFGIGVVMVKRNWVDCENWDMFSVWAGKHQTTIGEDRTEVATQIERIKRQEQAQRAGRAATSGETSPASSQQQEIFASQFRTLVADGQPLAAWVTFQRGVQQFPNWRVPEPDFVNYISVLRKQQQWDAAATAMQEYLKRYSERATIIRLALAQLLLQQLDRPQDALQLLGSMNDAFLEPPQKTAYGKLNAAAQQRLAAIQESKRPGS